MDASREAIYDLELERACVRFSTSRRRASTTMWFSEVSPIKSSLGVPASPSFSVKAGVPFIVSAEGNGVWSDDCAVSFFGEGGTVMFAGYNVRYLLISSDLDKLMNNVSSSN